MYSLLSLLPPAFTPEDTQGYIKYNLKTTTLAGVAQWIELWTMNQRLAGSIPSQGTCLGCGPGARSPVGDALEATTH